MVELLLAYNITQSGYGEALPMPAFDSRDPADCGGPIQTRQVWDIIWSCLSTIILCTWASVHPNIFATPEKAGMGRIEKHLWSPFVDILRYKVPLFLCALLVPEYILAWAIRQYIVAGQIKRKVPGWTRAHGFFLVMGGFQLFERPGPNLRPVGGEEQGITCSSVNPGKFIRILDGDDVDQHTLETIVPCTTEEDIKDRGKSDGIAKTIVLLQTTWFIIQCIARGIKHLPLTKLEVITLAYAMMNFFIYSFWWHKPRDVGCPIRVYESLKTDHRIAAEDHGVVDVPEKILKHILGAQDVYVQLSKRRKVPMFWCGFDDFDVCFRAALGPSILGMAFAGIHLIAWPYGFPSCTERILWGISCIVMATVPLFSAITCWFCVFQPRSKLWKWVGMTSTLLLLISAWMYIVARIVTIVMAFTTLRSLPSEAFRVVDWTTFIPHI